MSVSFRNINRNITLRSPEFSDKRKLATNLQVKTMMDSSLVTHRNRSRTIFEIAFTELSRVKAEELRDFVISQGGIRVTYTDVEGVDWSGYILNEELVLTADQKGRANSGGTVRAEAFSTTIEFEVADANADI